MIMKKFTKKKEDFICINCKKKVAGDGYTNHCPFCLYSLHVDESPGDRSSVCNGVMKPVNLIIKNKEEKIVHVCEKCGTQKLNRLHELDNREVIYKIIEQYIRENLTS